MRLSRPQALGGLLGGAVLLGAGVGGLAYVNRRFRPRSLAGARATHPVVIPLTPPLFNTYLVMGERPVLVDTGNPGGAGLMLARLRLRLLGLEPRQVALIVLTHGHADHFGSARAVQEATGAPVAVHEADASAVAMGIRLPTKPVGEVGLWGRLAQGQVRPWPRLRLEGLRPQVLLQGGETLERYGVDAAVVHTPGHTAGSVSLTFGRQAIVGDVFSADMLLPDRPDNPYFADDLGQNRSSIHTLLASPAQCFHVGHGLQVGRTAVHNRFAGEKVAPGEPRSRMVWQARA